MDDESVDKFFETEGEVAPEEPQEAPKEEVSETPKEEVKEDRQKTVPYGALHEERMRRKELAQRLEDSQAEQRQKIEAMERRFEQLVEKAKKPEFEQDPANNLRMTTEELNERLSVQQKYIDEQRQNTEYQRQLAEFTNRYQMDANQFSQATPDFQDAYRHVITSMNQELQTLGYTPEAAQRAMQEWETHVVSNAFSQGVSPAERLYEFAKMRGYNNAPKETQIEALEQGINANKPERGESVKEKTTLESLADMSDDDFDAQWDKLVG